MARILLALSLTALLAVILACADDNEDNDNEDGPADDVAGVWEGTYTSTQTDRGGDRGGDLCVDIRQGRRELTGTLIFSGEEPLTIGGRIANDRLSFVWQEEGGGESPAVVRFTTGGTFSGDADGNNLAGEWTSVDGDRGDWSAMRSATAACE